MAGYEDGAFFQVRARVQEVLGDEDGGGAAVGGRTALQFREGGVDHWRLEDLLEGVFSLELRVWVAFAVLVVYAGDFCKVLCFGSIPGMMLVRMMTQIGRYRYVKLIVGLRLLHVFTPSVSELLRGRGRICHPTCLFHHFDAGALLLHD